ncbi:MAG: carboxypeptidase regulatory-like domain-containing protein [Campylobacterales bacterium]|nr:carboxypeptidase regulatory-like domain-containing protein [Campylobacterales bacterium]
MHRIIFFLLASLFALIFITGCDDLRAPSLPGPKSENISQWPPLDDMDDEEIVDLSDIDNNIHEGSATVEDMQNDEVYERMDFPVNEYKKLARNGSSTVQGRIFLEDSYGGMVLKGKGTRLYLNPVTSYSKEWYVQSYAKGRIMTAADKQLFNYLRFTTSDENGNFIFYGVPAGRYYVIGTIVCGEECGFESVKNIRIATEVKVRQGGKVSVDLSKKL